MIPQLQQYLLFTTRASLPIGLGNYQLKQTVIKHLERAKYIKVVKIVVQLKAQPRYSRYYLLGYRISLKACLSQYNGLIYSLIVDEIAVEFAVELLLVAAALAGVLALAVISVLAGTAILVLALELALAEVLAEALVEALRYDGPQAICQR